MQKNLFLQDNIGKDIVDVSNLNPKDGLTKLRTKIIIKDHDTGMTLFTGRNKLILPGAEFLALSLFDLPATPITPTYNTKLNLENSVYVTTPQNTNKVYLFCVGTDGCGTENSQVFEEDYRKWIQPASMVPFQYRSKLKDLNASQRSIYFGRKKVGDFWAYYFKKFDSNPQLIRQFVNGTAIDNTIYDYTGATAVETYVNMTMSVTKDDCRDYFIETTGINDARINTISLCTAWAKTIGSYTYYQDIRPVTKLNFPNESLINLRKGIDINYQVFF